MGSMWRFIRWSPVSIAAPMNTKDLDLVRPFVDAYLELQAEIEERQHLQNDLKDELVSVCQTLRLDSKLQEGFLVDGIYVRLMSGVAECFDFNKLREMGVYDEIMETCLLRHDVAPILQILSHEDWVAQLQLLKS